MDIDIDAVQNHALKLTQKLVMLGLSHSEFEEFNKSQSQVIGQFGRYLMSQDVGTDNLDLRVECLIHALDVLEYRRSNFSKHPSNHWSRLYFDFTPYNDKAAGQSDTVFRKEFERISLSDWADKLVVSALTQIQALDKLSNPNFIETTDQPSTDIPLTLKSFSEAKEDRTLQLPPSPPLNRTM